MYTEKEPETINAVAREKKDTTPYKEERKGERKENN